MKSIRLLQQVTRVEIQVLRNFSGLFCIFQSTPRCHMELAADQPGPPPGLQEEVERSTRLLISSDVLTVNVADKCQTDSKTKDCDSADRSDSVWVTSACSEKNLISLSVLKVKAFRHNTKLQRDGWGVSQ